MAKKAWKERNKRKQETVKKYAAIRAENSGSSPRSVDSFKSCRSEMLRFRSSSEMPLGKSRFKTGLLPGRNMVG